MRVPRRMVSVEEAADHHVGFARAAMVRAPVQALQVRVGRHRREHAGMQESQTGRVRLIHAADAAR